MRGRDVGLLYAAAVLVTGLVELTSERDDTRRLVLSSSTNLHNLSHHPVPVLLTSAFLVASPAGLWVVPVVVAVFGGAQRWFGRLVTVVVALLGHVLSSLLVGVALAAGITHHLLSRRLADEPDVGVSYALAALLGLLVLRLPARVRWWAVGLVTVLLLGAVVVSQTFTDLGHLLAWLVGLAAAVALRPAPGPRELGRAAS